MVHDKIILIAKKHETWIDIVCTFGCTRRIAEDITQEMYIKIQLKLEEGKLDIMYNDEINYYYIFKTLNSIFIDLKRKNKNITICHLNENIDNNQNSNYYSEDWYDGKTNLLSHNDVNYLEVYEKIEDALSKMHWYDRKIFEVINGGERISDFSRKSKIPYYTLYFHYNKVKEKLKKLL